MTRLVELRNAISVVGTIAIGSVVLLGCSIAAAQNQQAAEKLMALKQH
jgi:hypothetical protein